MSMRSRRNFLCGLACGCAAAAAPWAASPVLAASDKPKTSVTADQAIELLKEGNAAFIQGSCTATSPARLHELAGGQAPFAVVVESEARHVEALRMLFTRREQEPPASIWRPGSFEPFTSVPAACAGGVAAETEDAALYTPFLERTDLPRDVRNVFTSLQAASLENHLPAFVLCQ